MESSPINALIIHIVAMSASLVISCVLITVATFRLLDVTKSAVILNYVVTVIGILSGIILLVANPAPSSCLVLFGYVVGFQLVHQLVIIPRISVHSTDQV